MREGAGILRVVVELVHERLLRDACLIGGTDGAGAVTPRSDRPRRTEPPALPSAADAAAPSPGACARVLRHPLVDRGYEPKGWRCTTCHQPDHLRADQVKVNAQPYAPRRCRNRKGRRCSLLSSRCRDWPLQAIRHYRPQRTPLAAI